MSFSFEQVKDAATGRWKDLIFPALGIEVPARPNKHAPCPACGGTDRFRCDDKQGNGTFICTHCGAGDGFHLVQLVRHWDNKQILNEIASILGLSSTSKISDEDRKKWREEQQRKQQQEQEQKIKGYETVKKKAVELWQSVVVSDVISPYLQRKQVSSYGCKIKDNGNLLVPMYDVDGELWNIQEIHSNGFKSFIKHGRVNDCFHVLGELTENTEIICIVEGYATGASVYAATAYTTIVSFNTSNLPKVAKALYSKYPKALYVYCADDDRHSTPPNGGLKAAQKGLAITGGIIVLPDFSLLEDIGENHD